jgi:hypothetical protein
MLVTTMPYDALFEFLRNAGRGTVVLLLLVPVITFLISWVHGVYDGRHAPWRQIYGLVVHLTTACVVSSAALIVLYVVDGGTVGQGAIPWIPFAALVGWWILSLLVVKRAVDFQHIPTVGNPLVPVIGWALGWTGGGFLYLSGLWLIPGPPLYTSLAAAFVGFCIVEMILMLLGPRR